MELSDLTAAGRSVDAVLSGTGSPWILICINYWGRWLGDASLSGTASNVGLSDMIVAGSSVMLCSREPAVFGYCFTGAGSSVMLCSREQPVMLD